MQLDNTNVDWTKFGELIRVRRAEKRLSQTDVARELGISQPAVSLIERGSPTGLTGDRVSALLSMLDIAETELPAAGKAKTPAGEKVFISYSHKDKDFLARLLVHLRPLEKKGLIDLWVDTRISAGEKWKEQIQKALAQARAAVLLVSADFLASNFIIDNELPPLLKKADEKGHRNYSCNLEAMSLHQRRKLIDIPVDQRARDTGIRDGRARSRTRL